MAWGSNLVPKALGGTAPAPAPAPSTFDQYVQLGTMYNAPTQAQYDLSMNAGYRNLQTGQAGYGLDQTGLQQQYLSNSRDLATQSGQNAIDLRAAQRQPELIAQLLGLDNQDYGLQNRDYDIQRADAGLDARISTQDLFSDATARGSMITQGRKTKQGNIYEALVNRMGHIDVAQDRTGVSQQKNTLNAGESAKQAQDRIDALNLTASRLGMQGSELKSMLDTQLQKLGLDHYISTENLLDGITKDDLASKQLLMQIYQQAGQYATAGN